MPSENAISPNYDGPYYISYDKNGNILSYNMPVPLEVPLAEDHTYLSSTLINKGHVDYGFLGCHPDTQIWRCVSSYSFSTSKTVGMSVSMNFTVGGNTGSFSSTIEVSASVSKGFSYTINVDQNRPSKLNVYCDYDWKLFRGDVCDEFTNEVIYSFNYLETVKTGEYFVPLYKDQ